MELKNKKILITGGAGFIGSHLCDALRPYNDITVYDNYSHAVTPFYPNEGMHGSVTDISRVNEAVQDKEIIFHLAAQNLRKSINNPEYVWDTNADGTIVMCRAASQSDTLERFIYISSSEVYGTAQFFSIDEKHTLEPTTIYGASKLAGEAISRAYYSTYKLPVTIIRPFNTYGEREHLDGTSGEVIPRFVNAAIKNESPVIYGNGRQSRDFTYIEDTVKGIIQASECDSIVGETINIARGHEVTINDLWFLISKKLDKFDLKPIYKNARPGDVYRHYACITKAERMLDFKPEYSISSGLDRYIAWFKDNQKVQELQEVNW